VLRDYDVLLLYTVLVVIVVPFERATDGRNGDRISIENPRGLALALARRGIKE
jgi:hypothetical protein